MTFANHVLELDKILDQLAQRTAFSASRALAAMLEPADDVELVRMRQARTTEARRLADAKPTLGMAGARDVRPHVERASLGGMLSTEELLEIAGVIRCSRLWRSTLLRLRESFPHLAAIADALGEHRPLLEQVGGAISENGEVLDAASAELRRIRVGLRISQERLLARLQEIISSPDTRVALQEPIVTQRNGRYVVPVKAESRGRIRGIVHDQSASGATIFVEPLEVVELANRWRGLQLEEEHEIERILREFSRQVADDAVGLGITVEALAEIDLQRAKARLANDMRAEPPEIAGWETRAPDEPALRLEEARHPLLGAGAVPLTIELGSAFDMLVITGPNTGGKTVALKTIGLHVLMAQVGLHLPTAPGSCLRPFRSVYADIGDEQSIEQSLSTFSSHITHIVEMLRGADDRSLLLLDELGAGTDPQEGSALARSILEHLRQRRVFAVVTTHYTDLKLYAYAAPRIENASVEFDAETLSPTYHLLVGQAGRSNALEIAGRLGVARAILDRARASLDPQNVEADRLLASLQAERRSTEQARQQAERERKVAARLRSELAKAQREAERDRQRLWQETEHTSREELADLRRQMERLLREAQASRGDRQRAAELVNQAASLRAVRPRLEASTPEPGLIV
ncbi:MAG: endonuclease MutS2, partial [Chloroflexi bacterium]|nr:endonuclease MutS2 [Chloroflexota bacterium]